MKWLQTRQRQPNEAGWRMGKWKWKEAMRRRRNNKTLLESKIKRMTDSKGIKSNEKNAPRSYQRNDFSLLSPMPCYKKHWCKYCFFSYLIETDRPSQRHQVKRAKLTINIPSLPFTVPALSPLVALTSDSKISLERNQENHLVKFIAGDIRVELRKHQTEWNFFEVNFILYYVKGVGEY